MHGNHEPDEPVSVAEATALDATITDADWRLIHGLWREGVTDAGLYRLLRLRARVRQDASGQDQPATGEALRLPQMDQMDQMDQWAGDPKPVKGGRDRLLQLLQVEADLLSLQQELAAHCAHLRLLQHQQALGSARPEVAAMVQNLQQKQQRLAAALNRVRTTVVQLREARVAPPVPDR